MKLKSKTNSVLQTYIHTLLAQLIKEFIQISCIVQPNCDISFKKKKKKKKKLNCDIEVSIKINLKSHKQEERGKGKRKKRRMSMPQWRVKLVMKHNRSFLIKPCLSKSLSFDSVRPLALQ
jgi:hypothetical protein